MQTQRDLSLAYSPGVAVPVEAIGKDEDLAYDYTAKGNTVAVISNGTAILGLGDLGAMASKPVMEGKSVLFKRFADIDSFDVEVQTKDVDEFCTVVRNIGATWGGINLEDIASPEALSSNSVCATNSTFQSSTTISMALRSSQPRVSSMPALSLDAGSRT